MKKIREMIKSFKLKWPTYKKILIGNSNHHGLLYKIAIYFLSITFAFVFLYPIFYMFMISLMSNTDLVDSTILWIPSSIHWENYQFGLRGLFMDQTYIKYLSEFFTVLDVNGELLNGTFADALKDPEPLSTPYLTEVLKIIVIIGIIPLTLFIGRIFTNNWKKLLIISIAIVVVAFILPVGYVNGFYIAGTTTFTTILSSALIGYGLARFKFKGKNFVIVMLLVIYILPNTLLFIPRAQIYNELGIKGSMFALWIPSLLGQGVQATFFILIFFQFFRLIPKQIEESAYLDGASSLDIFIRIALPMAVPAFIISITYGFAVTWNEIFLTNFYLEGNVDTIPMLLQALSDEWGRFADFSSPDTANIDFSEAKAFAGTLLSIIPLVIMYGIIQRYFIESIDKSGITGE